MKTTIQNNGIRKASAALISTLLIFVLVLGSASPLYAYTKVGNKKVEAPSVTAKSAIMYSDDLGKVIYSKNEDTKVNPYSITKLLTAYLVIENLDLDQEVTASNNAANPPEGSSSINLKEGEVMTVENLLYGLLIESGNDAAIALAEEVSGSEENFAELMTKTAREWGCKNTSFANASGMQDKNHYTTAADYLIISEKAYGVELIRKITSTKKYTIPATNKSSARKLENHVILINEEGSGVVRGKTGRWSDDDCSVSLQYFNKDMSVTLILIEDTKTGRISDCRKLLAYSHDVTPGFKVANTKDSVGKLWISGGKYTHIAVYAKSEVYAYPASEDEDDIKVKLIKGEGVKAPLKKGDIVGTMKIYANDKCVATRKLIVKEDVEKGWFTSAVYISNKLAIVLLIAVVAYVILLIVVAKKRAEKRRRYEARRAKRNTNKH